MYIIKNAIRSILRSKGRNILIIIIAFVIATSACIVLSIRQSAETTREDTLKGMKITASIGVDRSKMMQNMNNQDGNTPSKDDFKEMLQSTKDLSLEEMQTYSKCRSVEDFYYSMSVSLNASDDIEAVDSSINIENTETAQKNNNQNSRPDMPSDFSNEHNTSDKKGGPVMRGGMGSQGDFTVVGYSSEDAMTDFIDGTAKITDGEMFDISKSTNNCLISSELATLNSLSIGDKIKLQNPNDEDETVKFTITGIYTSSASSDGGEMRGFGASQDSANRIYTSYKCTEKIVEKSEDKASVSTDSTTGFEISSAIRGITNGTYVFSSADNYYKFEEEAKNAGLSDDYTISSQDINEYENSLTPLENLSSFASWFLVIVLIIGAIILVVFNIFNIRGRKYEIGVLTAIGMKKYKVATQFLIETFTVTFVAIILGAIIGAVSSVPITNALLENQITSTESQSQQIEENFGRGGPMGAGQNNAPPEMMGDKGFTGNFPGEQTNFVDSVNSATDIMVILQLVLIGLALTIISSLSSVVFVMRYEPLKILTQRD